MRRPIVIVIIVIAVVVVVLGLVWLALSGNKSKLVELKFTLVQPISFDRLVSTSNGLYAIRSNNILKFNEANNTFVALGSVKVGTIKISNDGQFISSGDKLETIIYSADLKQLKSVPSQFFGWYGSGSGYVFTAPTPFTPGTDVIPDTKEQLFIGSTQTTATSKLVSTNAPYNVVASTNADIVLASGIEYSTIVSKINLGTKSITKIVELAQPIFTRTATPTLSTLVDQTTGVGNIATIDASGVYNKTNTFNNLNNIFAEDANNLLQADVSEKTTIISRRQTNPQSTIQLYKLAVVVTPLNGFVKYNNVLVFNSAKGVIVSQLPGDNQ